MSPVSYLRTPESRFDNLPDYPWPACYTSDLPALGGLRLHCLDVGPHDAPAEKPLPDGFVQWRSMCRSKPDFAISRLFSRGNPQMSEGARASAAVRG